MIVYFPGHAEGSSPNKGLWHRKNRRKYRNSICLRAHSYRILRSRSRIIRLHHEDRISNEVLSYVFSLVRIQHLPTVLLAIRHELARHNEG